jgi:hypothetical protein
MKDYGGLKNNETEKLFGNVGNHGLYVVLRSTGFSESCYQW